MESKQEWDVSVASWEGCRNCYLIARHAHSIFWSRWHKVIRIADIAVLALALLAAQAPSAAAQNAPPTLPLDRPPANVPNAPAAVLVDTPAATATASPPPVAPEAPPANRITGIQTNRDMIAAEAPTEIAISGTLVAHCGLVVDFGDGTRSGNVVSESSPFPLRLSHTYPKTDDVIVRVTGADEGSAPPCEGAVEAAVHVSPAGSKIEYITLTTGCPEGWLLKGAVNTDKSFMCAPIPDASAPTNLIHCIDGMKYFARDGHVGCRHPQAAAPEQYAKAKTPMAKGKAPNKAGESMAKAKTPPASKAQGKVPPKTPVKPKVQPGIKSPEAPN
jgi:hypothetical protein